MNKVTKFFFVFFLIVGLFATSRMGDGKVASAQGVQVQWNAIINLSPDQAIYAQDTSAKMASAMQAKGVAGKFADGKLQLSGSQGLDQLRSALFDDAAEWVDFLGGPVELTLTLPAENTPVILKMQARMTAGYVWEVLASNKTRYAQNGEATFEARYPALGAPAIQTIELQSKGSGDGTVQLVYRRPFEKQAPIHARVSLQLAKTSGVIDISDLTPAEPAAPKDDVQGSDQANPYDELQAQSLPAAYDTRSLGIVPAVRDQGGCGGCWAFGTVAIMESAVKKGGGPLTDLSEQFLISCNNSGWNCDGGLTANLYHYNTLGKAQTAIGAVLESAKPYSASNGSCTVALPHPYKASNWQFIVPNEWTMPTVDQIKTAIYTYGPVTAGVCVGPAFDNYTPGTVFSTDETASQCPWSTFKTNHQIVLVGWNDATQSWIMRNSWGSSWGNAGYMNIKWNTSRVGEGTSWIKYVGTTVTVPTLVAPSGLISDTTPTYSFTKVPGATQYQYLLYKGTTLVYTKTVATSACGSTANCVNTPTTVLPYAAYTWKARAMTAGTWKAFSAVKAFTITKVPTPIAPSGAITTTKPSFTFTKIIGATQYRYQLLKGTTSVYIKTVAATACGTTANCVNTPTTVLGAGAYTWKVQSYVGGVWNAYSAAKAFTLSTGGFNTQFTSDAVGWTPANGSWGVGSGYYKTAGLAAKVVSSAHVTNYSTFTYEVKMLRTGCVGCENIVYFRGTPAPLNSIADWNNGYELNISNDGWFYFGAEQNGEYYPFLGWTQSSAITSGWNTVKITMNGNYFQIFVNGTRILYGTLTGFNSGQVGAGLWRTSSSTGDILSIDYATLIMSAPASASQSTEGINLDTVGPVDQSASGRAYRSLK